MKKTVWMILVALAIASPAFAQINIVREERAKVTTAPPIGNAQAFEITKRVARRIPGAGVLKKPGGNNVDGFAVDIVCFLAGGRIVDILGASEETAVPQWNVLDEVRPAMDCAPVPGSVNEPPPPVVVPPPPASNAATADLQQQQLAALLQMIAELKAQNVALTQGLADVKAAIAAGIKIRF